MGLLLVAYHRGDQHGEVLPSLRPPDPLPVGRDRHGSTNGPYGVTPSAAAILPTSQVNVLSWAVISAGKST
jgi:hypothetical protein